jgi:hypothetical protein
VISSNSMILGSIARARAIATHADPLAGGGDLALRHAQAPTGSMVQIFGDSVTRDWILP